MEHKIIASLLIGYTIALLPIWDWNTRPELFANNSAEHHMPSNSGLAAGEEQLKKPSRLQT